MATNSNCGSFGPNSTEYDHQNANAKLLEQIKFVPENGAANSSVDCLADPCIELPADPDAMDSNQERNRQELENWNVNSNVEGMTFPAEYEATNSTVEYSSQPSKGVTGNRCLQQLKETHADAMESPRRLLVRMNENNEEQAKMVILESGLEGELSCSGHGFSRPTSEDFVSNFSCENVDLPPGYGPPGYSGLRETCKDANQNPLQLEHEEKEPLEPPSNCKSTFITDVSPTRVLCPDANKKSESLLENSAAAADSDNGENNRMRNEEQKKQNAVNEFPRIMTKLRYLLNRIKYERNLIDAYSGEGWKGKSLDKIKPEKELQRAKSGISTYKLKIRDLFQRIDMLLAQGRLPESSYDPEGLIDSEEIFCAKCGSKDLTADNDIILCDGGCERGFHQFCLEPPLLKEHIPPGDEAWLCPGCVCKLGCVNLLNDIQGTNLSLTDRWEKVFSEEAATATLGKKLDDISGLPSDDSEDDDYNPDNVEVEENVSGDESTSEESDYFSASDDLAAPVINDDKLMGLPSEDSEDDDYDPDAPDQDAQVMQESSSSDFTSDADDFGPVVTSQDQHGKTEVDETMSFDSTDGCTAAKRKNRSCEDAQKSSDQTATGAMNTNVNQSEVEHTTQRRSQKRLKVEGSVTSEHGSSRKKNTKSKFGEDVIKRLFESFQENQYPQRDVKESLAAKLGLTVQQVSKWFENARWSFHNSSNSQARNQS